MYSETLSQSNDVSLVIQSCERLASSFEQKPIDTARESVLQNLAKILEREVEALAAVMSQESQRPIALCRTECKRAIETVRKTILAMHQLATPMNYDFSQALQGGATARAQRFSFSPLFAIVPFNFPLNLALHKIAPAIALGLPFVCKPPSQHLGLYKRLHALLLEAGVKDDNFLIWAAKSEQVQTVLEAIPFGLISFTGSAAVGWQLKQKFPRRRLILELGGTATCVVCDDASLGLQKIAEDLAKSAFAQAGQSCISTQHILIEKGLLTIFAEFLKTAAENLSQHTAADDPQTVCGTLVDEKAYKKALALVQNARVFGFEIFQASTTTTLKNYLPPTLFLCEEASQLSHAEIDFLREEFFAPIVTLIPFTRLNDALALAERLDANIHASVYTKDANALEIFYRRLPARSVLHNMPPSWRADEMPYGGSDKQWAGRFANIHNGLIGNEGPLQTMMEYTMDRLLVESIQK